MPLRFRAGAGFEDPDFGCRVAYAVCNPSGGFGDFRLVFKVHLRVPTVRVPSNTPFSAPQ